MDLREPLKQIDSRKAFTTDGVMELLSHYYALGWHVEVKLHTEKTKPGLSRKDGSPIDIWYELIAYKKVL